MKHINRFLSILLSVCMAVSLMPWAAMPVRAEATAVAEVGNTEYDVFIKEWSIGR